MMEDCYQRFTHSDIITLPQVGPYHILEMWHGPTGAFKDLALVVTGCLVDHFLQKRGKKAVAVVGTSGDTGSAAIQSVLPSKRVRIVVLYPKYRVTELQKRQMTTISSPNVQVFACDGTSDDLDAPIRQIFADRSFVSQHTLIGLNSINIGRVLFQAVHYIYAYLQLHPAVDSDLTFFVPTGALGNLTGGYLSHLMGLPVKFVAAVNENDIVHRSLSQGQLTLSDEVVQTYSSAMDIQFPYNIERLLYYMSDCSPAQVNSVMKQLETQGGSTIPPSVLQKNDCIKTVMIPQSEATTVAAKFFTEFSYTMCPHTAVGVAAAERMAGKEGSNVVCLATATAAKFPEFLQQFDAPCPSHQGLEGIWEKPQHDKDMKAGEDWEAMLRRAITNF